MKQKNIIIIILVACVSALASFIIANSIFGGEKHFSLTAPSIEPISQEFNQLDTRYFNKDSLNPTKTIIIGESQNEKPFNN